METKTTPRFPIVWKSLGFMALCLEGWQQVILLEVLVHLWPTKDERKASGRQIHSYLRQKIHHFHLTFQFGHTSKYWQRQILCLIPIFNFKPFTSSFRCLLQLVCYNTGLLPYISHPFKWKWKAKHDRWMHWFWSSDRDAVVYQLFQ